MQIVLLATGETKKLFPLTETIPAPMIPLVNQPVMGYAIECVARQGFKDILVCLHYLAGSIESYFGDGKRWGVKLHYFLLPKAQGTGGALRRLQYHLKDRFIVLPADIFMSLDIKSALNHHSTQRNAITAITWWDVDYQEARSTGAYICEPEILAHIPQEIASDNQSDLLSYLDQKRQRTGHFQNNDYVNFIRSFREHQSAQMHLIQSPQAMTHRELIRKNGLVSEGTVPFYGLNGRQIADNIWVGRNNSIHPSVRFTPPIYIGDNNQIGREVDLGPGTIIGSNVIVDDEATVSDSTILDDTYIGRLILINRRIVRENLVVDIDTEAFVRVSEAMFLSRIDRTFSDSGYMRIVDILILVVTLPILMPLIILVGLIVWIAGDKVLDSQEMINTGIYNNSRVDSDTFKLWRFSTKLGNGNRLKLGRWLEKRQLHRLPELYNILRGDMRLVGVHPMTADQADHLTEEWQKKVLEYKPGFTGLWNVQSMGSDSEDEFLVNDAYYVVMRTWQMDLKILWQTVKLWFKHIPS
jgi:NDP-sugar pyrophosphorylase family protein